MNSSHHYDSFSMAHVEDKGDVWVKTAMDQTIDLVNKKLLAPLHGAPPIVESFQMQLKKGADFMQEVSETKLMQSEGRGDSNTPPPSYEDVKKSVEEDDCVLEEKRIAQQRRRNSVCTLVSEE